MSSVLKKLNARAKALVKKNPRMKYKSAQKQAGREYRAGKISGVKKKKASRPHKRKVSGIRRNSDKTDKKRVNITVGKVGTLSGHMSAAKRILAEQIGWAMAAQMSAQTKLAKRKIGKQIAELKAKYRKMC